MRKNNDTIDLLLAKTLIFKLFLFKIIFIAVIVFDIKLNPKFKKFKLIINFSRKSGIFKTAAAKATVKIKNEKINLINYVDYKAGI